ncbi:hypothetical protein HYV50_05625 [Candidatus Pacearchaeota archaeon]|nr:hypothetical protein [Candidatus Pacearchaeota archaeon]
MQRIIGFQSRKRRERAPQTPERIERLGLGLVDSDREPHPFYRNRPLKVISKDGTNYLGIYRGLTESGLLVLLPSVQYDFSPSDSTRNTLQRKILYLEEERPELIFIEAAAIYSPISRSYLNGIVKQTEKSKAKSNKQSPTPKNNPR